MNRGVSPLRSLGTSACRCSIHQRQGCSTRIQRAAQGPCTLASLGICWIFSLGSMWLPGSSLLSWCLFSKWFLFSFSLWRRWWRCWVWYQSGWSLCDGFCSFRILFCTLGFSPPVRIVGCWRDSELIRRRARWRESQSSTGTWNSLLGGW